MLIKKYIYFANVEIHEFDISLIEFCVLKI